MNTLRRLATCTLAVQLMLAVIAAPITASETHVAVIDGILDDVIAAVNSDPEAYEAAKDELYATYLEPGTPDECRRYIDVVLVGIAVIEMSQRYPASVAAQQVIAWASETSMVYQNDCLLAI